MRYRRLLNLLAICAGILSAAVGLFLLAIVASGNVAQGQMGTTLSGIGFLLVAAPALAMPFSAKAAKWLLFPVLAYFSILTIKLAFWPQSGVTPAPLVQAAVVAFVILLVVRVLLSRRNKNADLGT